MEKFEEHRTCQIGGHDEVVLDDEGRLLGVHYEAFDHLRIKFDYLAQCLKLNTSQFSSKSRQ